MKKVIMKTNYAGPSGTCSPRKSTILEDNEADALVKGGYAEYAVVAEETTTVPKGKGGKAGGKDGAEAGNTSRN